MGKMRDFLIKLLKKGYHITRIERQYPDIGQYPDIEKDHFKIINKVKPYTVTSVERINELLRAVDYIYNAGVKGSIVECGVYKGGSMMACALRLLETGDTHRNLYLYDTFEGMPEGDEMDKDFFGNTHAFYKDWVCAGLDEVRNNLYFTKYPVENIKFVKGKVEDTLKKTTPEKIALLRLDTDYYSSTRCELEYLYDRISTGGVLIIDDYGHFQGCKKAVDEFFQRRGETVFLSRIDYCGRLIIKR